MSLRKLIEEARQRPAYAEQLRELRLAERKTVKLIGCGMVPAINARELKPGHIKLYNYGCKSVIVAVKIQGCWLNYLVREVGTRRTIDRRCRLSSHIPVLHCRYCGKPIRVTPDHIGEIPEVCAKDCF